MKDEFGRRAFLKHTAGLGLAGITGTNISYRAARTPQKKKCLLPKT